MILLKPINKKTIVILNVSLTKIPDLFNKFPKLQQLTISNTLIEELPESLAKLKNLKTKTI